MLGVYEVASSGSVELKFCSSGAACSNMCGGHLSKGYDNRIPTSRQLQGCILDGEGTQWQYHHYYWPRENLLKSQGIDYGVEKVITIIINNKRLYTYSTCTHKIRSSRGAVHLTLLSLKNSPFHLENLRTYLLLSYANA